MASTCVAPAPAPTRNVIGPVCTQAGFQYWYLVCLPDSIVAVRLGMSAFFAFALSSGAVAPLFGLVGALIFHAFKGHSQKYRLRTETLLQNMPEARLRTKGNFVYPVNVLKAITFKDVKSAGNLILPSIIIETRRGGKQRYGMPHPDFEKACEQLKKLYPELCK